MNNVISSRHFLKLKAFQVDNSFSFCLLTTFNHNLKRCLSSSFEVDIVSKNPYAAALKRGTGGRSSFNGSVVTVFGAGGMLGHTLVNKLAKIGTQVIVPYRCEPIKIRDLKLCGDLGQIMFLPFYLRNEESIYRALKYSNAVVNLIGKIKDTPSFTLEEVHVDGARLIAKMAREAGIKKFIHVSALNASPNPKPLFIKGGSKFYKTKYYGELAIREEFPEAIIFRPSDMFGPMDDFFSYYSIRTRRTLGGEITLWKKGKEIYKQPVFMDNVAEGIASALIYSQADGQTYDAVGPRRYELCEIVRYFNEILERSEADNMGILDMRFHPSEWLKISVVDWLRKYPPICWERTETEHYTDETTGNPTLMDLGIQLTTLESVSKTNLYWRRRCGYYNAPIHEMKPYSPPRTV